jgi:cold shock CspA family protein
VTNGVVRSMPEGKQFGFIQVGDTKDVFFHRDDFSGHWNDLLKDFRAGKPVPVEFEQVESPKGLRATNVKRTDFPN